MLTGVLAEKEINIPTPWFARKSADNPTDVAIIGGGLASLTAAYALHNRGAKVTLYAKMHKLHRMLRAIAKGLFTPYSPAIATHSNAFCQRFPLLLAFITN